MGSDITSPVKSSAATDSSGSDITSPAKSSAATSNSGSDILLTKSTAATDSSENDITATSESAAATDSNGSDITPSAKSSAAIDNRGRNITRTNTTTTVIDSNRSHISQLTDHQQTEGIEPLPNMDRSGRDFLAKTNMRKYSLETKEREMVLPEDRRKNTIKVTTLNIQGLRSNKYCLTEIMNQACRHHLHTGALAIYIRTTRDRKHIIHS